MNHTFYRGVDWHDPLIRAYLFSSCPHTFEEDRLAYAKKRFSNLNRAYLDQKNDAARRGIEWQFTFPSWVKWWAHSGKLHMRGCKRGQYVMARFKDEGPYHPNNVEPITALENMRQEQVKAKLSAKSKARWAAIDPDREARIARQKSKPVLAPDGTIYQSSALAAEAHGVTQQAIKYRCTANSRGWSWHGDG